MNRLEELKSKFDIAEPIFDYELTEMGFSDKDIKDTLEENVFEELFGVDYVPCRIFYIVGYSDFTKDYIRLYDSSLSIIEKYYIGKDFDYGYYFGLTLQNKIGLSTQVPSKVYIKSNRAVSNISNDLFVIESDICYSRSDLEYIYLAEVLNFNGRPEYDISEIVNTLKSKCVDEKKLERYLNR